MNLCRWICKKLCGVAYEDEKPLEIPLAVREASHQLNNEVMALSAHIRRLQTTTKTLSSLVIATPEPAQPP